MNEVLNKSLYKFHYYARGAGKESAINKEAEQLDHQQPEADSGETYNRVGSAYSEDPLETDRSYCYRYAFGF